MVRRTLFALFAGLVAVTAQAETPASQLFGAARSGSQQAPSSIGTYARGCAAGLEELPETGPTWQAMRLSRNRNWGHPEAIDFIERLSQEAVRIGWKGLYIGDISQPRGGPAVSGHRSHQIGLDIDIWMLPPSRLNLTRAEREKISSLDVRSRDQRSVNDNWSRRHAAVLKAAALDPAVDRIFVTAPVKVELCKSAKASDKVWLQKIRPLYGHNTHFHVRLKCPPGSASCETQKPTVSSLSKGGNGCDETLRWWVTDYLNPPKPSKPAKKPSKPAPKKKHPREYTMAELPSQCRSVLKSR